MRWGSIAIVMCACGSPNTPSSAPPPRVAPDAAARAPVDAAPVAVVAVPIDAAPAEPPPVDAGAALPPEPEPAALTFPADPPPVKGKRHALTKNKALKLSGGRTITWLGAGHKIKVRGGDIPFHEIRIAKGKKSEDLRIGGRDGKPLAAEVDVYGTLVVFTGAWDSLTATVVGKTPTKKKRLDEDSAAALIEKKAAAAGLPTPSGSASSAEQGFLEYEARDENQQPLWGARVGLYTRRIWFFAAPRSNDPCDADPLDC